MNASVAVWVAGTLAFVAGIVPGAAQDGSGDQPGTAAPEGVLVTRGSETMVAGELGAIAVIGPDGQQIGDVEETILTHDGRVVGLVVGVGGFLGLAEKPVGILYDHLKVRPIEKGFEFVTDLDRATLEAAPAYRKRKE